jgi:hypothetical protein
MRRPGRKQEAVPFPTGKNYHPGKYCRKGKKSTYPNQNSAMIKLGY